MKVAVITLPELKAKCERYAPEAAPIESSVAP